LVDDPSLRPDEKVQKILLSTTSRLVGEFESKGLLIAHAHYGLRSRDSLRRESEGPTSRSAYVVAFSTPGLDKRAGIVIPTFEHVGEQIAAYLAVLFGKRFDSHGSIESTGWFNLPDLSHYQVSCDERLPQNSHAQRSDLPVDLNVSNVEIIRPLLFGGEFKEEDKEIFQAAAKFYLRALQLIETEPDIAYLNLVTCGEIISNRHKATNSRKVEGRLGEILDRIREEMPDGQKIAQYLSGQFRGIKAKYVDAVCDLVQEQFFENSPSEHDYMKLNRRDFRKRIAASYDLRSIYLHTGQPFGNWIMPRWRGLEEIQSGKPVVLSKRFASALHLAPTYLGLERIMRHVLIKFATGAKLFNELNPPSKSAPPTPSPSG
jgi:Apea-like HEPN